MKRDPAVDALLAFLASPMPIRDALTAWLASLPTERATG